MTAAEKQAPFVPAHVDLRGYDFIPLHGHKLYGSDFNAKASDSEFRAAMSLWWQAWNQIPAASLPNDEVILTKLADLGRDVRAFRKVREHALYGFEECSDGRLYHKALSEWAIEAWDRRVKERQRKANWRATRHTVDGDGDGTKTGQIPGQRRDTERDGDGTSPLKGSEAKVSEVKRSDSESKTASVVTPTIPVPVDHVNGKDAIRNTGNVNGKDLGQKWDNKAWVAATAQTLGMEQRNNEQWPDYRDRVFAGVQAQLNNAKAQASRAKA